MRLLSIFLGFLLAVGMSSCANGPAYNHSSERRANEDLYRFLDSLTFEEVFGERAKLENTRASQYRHCKYVLILGSKVYANGQIAAYHGTLCGYQLKPCSEIGKMRPDVRKEMYRLADPGVTLACRAP